MTSSRLEEVPISIPLENPSGKTSYTFPTRSGNCSPLSLGFLSSDSLNNMIRGEEIEVRSGVPKAKVKLENPLC